MLRCRLAHSVRLRRYVTCGQSISCLIHTPPGPSWQISAGSSPSAASVPETVTCTRAAPAHVFLRTGLLSGKTCHSVSTAQKLAWSGSPKLRRPTTLHVLGRFEPRRVGHSGKHGATENMACSGAPRDQVRRPEHAMFWSAQPRQQVHDSREEQTTGAWTIQTKTGLSLKETSERPEHGLFWAFQTPGSNAQNMPCSGRSSLRTPRTCHVLGVRRLGRPEHDMFWASEKCLQIIRGRQVHGRVEAPDLSQRIRRLKGYRALGL